MNPLIETRNVGVEYSSGRRKLRALDRIDFSVHSGEVVSVLGPSGCGKSTLLSVLAGLLRPSEGEVFYQGHPVTKPSRERVVIFQNHALFPWLTAKSNVEFSLRARLRDKKEIRERAEHYLELVGLRAFQTLYPHQLSGGMRQRVGIARALAAEPRLLLLDEPFASLDVYQRDEILQEFLALVRKVKMATVLVTHDIEEALFMGDRLHLMSKHPGRIVKSVDLVHAKPDKILELKQQREFWTLEKEIHEHLFQQGG
jgi:NitT/TauT family transport system ATP-binding protein